LDSTGGGVEELGGLMFEHSLEEGG
jgi:hypothetical protein